MKSSSSRRQSVIANKRLPEIPELMRQQLSMMVEDLKEKLLKETEKNKQEPFRKASSSSSGS